MRIQLHQLILAYPPISNQEAEWLKNDREVQKQLQNSNLYFIGQKPESTYEFEYNVQTKIENQRVVCFFVRTGSKRSSASIDIDDLLDFYGLQHECELEIELGPKLIRFWRVDNARKDIIDWFTTDKLLFDKWRKKDFIHGFDDYREFSVYQLHYVGISKKENSLKRLVVKPHDKRLRILSNEHPLSIGSRVTDEMVLFFFEIDSLEIKQFIEEQDFSEIGFNELEDKIKIVADAEKAFVKIMDTQYNEVKFKQYPFSDDGLYNSKVNRYSFSINEDLTFISSDNVIKGERGTLNEFSNSDFISINVESKEVELVKNEN